MTQSKFAPVTANLLVRKGEAAPSPVASPPPSSVTWLSDVSRRAPSAEGPEHKFVFHQSDAPDNPGDQGHEKLRRIVLNLTPHEYETLGLVAVKKNTTRHQLAQEAMDAYFDWLMSEYGEACACIAGGVLCRCECGAKQ